jgi:Transposase
MKSQQNTSDRALCSNLKIPNRLDFSSKDLHVGIDVHKERWQVAVYHEGMILSNVSIESNAQKLISYLRKRYGGAQLHCVYESCAFGFHLCRTLREAGINCTIVNPADIPGTDKEHKSKTDKVDARKLAVIVRLLSDRISIRLISWAWPASNFFSIFFSPNLLLFYYQPQLGITCLFLKEYHSEFPSNPYYYFRQKNNYFYWKIEKE